MDAITPFPPLNSGHLICVSCGLRAACPPADQAYFLRTKAWPRCCDRVMAFTPIPYPDHQPDLRERAAPRPRHSTARTANQS